MWDKNWLQMVNLTRFGCPVRFYMESPTPIPSHGVQYSILMTLYNMCCGAPPPPPPAAYLYWSSFDQLEYFRMKTAAMV